jgi:uncharacterized protein
MTQIALKEQIIEELIPQETIDGVINTIVENFSPDKIILFGSYASENPTSDSDLDLLIIMETTLPSHKRASPIRLLFKPFPCSMDILVFTPEEVEYWNGTTNHIVTEAFRTGKVVYERT